MHTSPASGHWTRTCSSMLVWRCSMVWSSLPWWVNSYKIPVSMSIPQSTIVPADYILGKRITKSINHQQKAKITRKQSTYSNKKSIYYRSITKTIQKHPKPSKNHQHINHSEVKSYGIHESELRTLHVGFLSWGIHGIHRSALSESLLLWRAGVHRICRPRCPKKSPGNDGMAARVQKDAGPQFWDKWTSNPRWKHHLVGGWATPLKNMKVNWDD